MTLRAATANREVRTQAPRRPTAPFGLLAPAAAVVVLLFGGGLALGMAQSLGYLPAAGMSELTLAHAGLTRGYARHFETAEQVARATAQLALHDLPERYYEEFPDRVRGVGADQVTRAARRWLKADALATVVVGDRARVADGLDALGLGPVELWDR